MKAKNLGLPKISLQFELSTSGITRLVKAEAAVEEIVIVQEEEQVDGDDENTTEPIVDAAETNPKDTADGEAGNSDKTKDSKDDKKSEKDDKKKKKKTVLVDKVSVEKPGAFIVTPQLENGLIRQIFGLRPRKPAFVAKEKKKVHRKTLGISSYHIGRVQPYSPQIMLESKAKMEALAKKDKDRQMLESAKNMVESYIYKIKNKLIDDEENVKLVTTEEQRGHLSKIASDAEEWLYDEGYGADLATMQDKFVELEAPAEKVFFRVAELTARPAAVAALKEKLDKIVALMTKWETTHPHITAEERGDVVGKVEDIKNWLAEKEAEQEKVATSDDPVFSSAELKAKTKAVESVVGRLSKKPKPKPPKKKKEETNETKSENATDAENESIVDEGTDASSDKTSAAEGGSNETTPEEKSGDADAASNVETDPEVTSQGGDEL